MKNYFAILLILSISILNISRVFANVESRRVELINIIDQELSEVTRLNAQTKGKRPVLLLRMAELLLEKARLIKEVEADKFIGLSRKARNKKGMKNAFKKSTKYFNQAKKTCGFILKHYPSYRNKADVFYILAYHAKEFYDEKNAEKYFKSAIRYSKNGSSINKKATIALAEIHYNNKRYSRAIPLYEKSLRGKKDKWWTKDSYNLAWCYFRVDKHSKAISLFEEIYKRSGDKTFINMKRQLDKNLPYIYAEAGRHNDAIAFFNKSGGDLAPKLIKIVKNLLDKGSNKEAEKIFSRLDGLKLTTEQVTAIGFLKLTLYDRIGNNTRHLQVIKSLVDLYKNKQLEKSYFELLKNQIEKHAALFQRSAVAKGKINSHKKAKAKFAVSYFELMAELNPALDYKYWFSCAETLYSVKQFNEAIIFYGKSIKAAALRKNRKIQALASNGLLATLGQKGVSKANKDKYTISAYKKFLSSNPKSKKSHKIYQRLFSSYIVSNNIAEAEMILLAFQQHFPKDFSIQEAMLAKVMDHYKNSKNSKGIQKWVKNINNGKIKVSSKYAHNLQLYLINQQFEEVENATNKGDKKKALKLYMTIFKEKKSTPTAKKNAAYNIAVLFHELGNSQYMYKWAKLALSLMSNKDIKKFEGSFLSFASDLFNKRRLAESALLYNVTYNKLCNQKSKNKKTFFKNANIIYLLNKSINKSDNLISSATRCKIPRSYIYEANLDNLKVLRETSSWRKFQIKLSQLSKNRKYHGALIYPSYHYYQYYKKINNFKKTRQIKKSIEKFYLSALKNNQEIPLEGLDVVANFRLNDLNKKIKKFSSYKLRYPEKKFNKILEYKFTQLDAITSSALKILKVRSGKGMVKAYKYLVESYNKFSDEVEQFSPPRKSQEYIKSFRKSMKELVLPLRSKAKEFYKEARHQIIKNNIFSNDNYWFLTKSNDDFKVEYQINSEGVIMDRGGQR